MVHHLASTAGLICFTVLIWGLTWVAMRAGLRCFDPLPLAGGRLLFCAIPLILWWLVRQRRLPAWPDLWRLAAAGLSGFMIYGVLVFAGQRTVGAGPAAVIIQTAPIWTGIGAWLLWGERIGARTWIGLAVSLAGVALIARGEGSQGGAALSTDVLLLFGASLAFSAFNLLVRPVAQRLGALAAVGWSVVFGSLGFIPWSGEALRQTMAAGWWGWTLMVILGFISVLITYATWAAVLSRLPAARAGMFLYLVPVVAMAGGWLILGEVPTTASLLGAVVILAGVAVAQTERRA